MRLILTIPGVPISQPRAKAVSFAGHARVYNPKGAVDCWKAAIRLEAARLYGGPLLRQARVDWVCVFPLTQAEAKRRPPRREPHTKKPDRDNLDKAILDALVGVVLADDRAVYAGTIEKWIAADGEKPHAVITITSENGEEYREEDIEEHTEEQELCEGVEDEEPNP